MADKKTAAGKRYRNFATVVYPDSQNLPENWREIIADLHVPAFISPLHDSDVNPTGEKKKPHYHVMLMFEGAKSREQVVEIFSTFDGVGCEIVQSQRSYARYLCHLDNPLKHQYNIQDVVCVSGADYATVIESSADRNAAIDEMCDYCLSNNIVSFFKLCEYARHNRPDWSRHLKNDCTVYMREYLKSLLWTYEEREKISKISFIDPDTGELLV